MGISTRGVEYRGKAVAVSELFGAALEAFMIGSDANPVRHFSPALRDPFLPLSQDEANILADCLDGTLKPFTQAERVGHADVKIYREVEFLRNREGISKYEAYKRLAAIVNQDANNIGRRARRGQKSAQGESGFDIYEDSDGNYFTVLRLRKGKDRGDKR